jgi:hypothetical protein
MMLLLRFSCGILGTLLDFVARLIAVAAEPVVIALAMINYTSRYDDFS